MSEARDTQEKSARLEWVEPEIKQLNISDTEFTDGYGGDTTYAGYPDVAAS